MANSFGIPAQIIAKDSTSWLTTLDPPYTAQSHELIWFLKPIDSTNWAEYLYATPLGAGWSTVADLDTNKTEWVWNLKARDRQTAAVTDVGSGTFTCLVVLSALEEKIAALEEAILAIGSGNRVKSYSVDGRQLERYSLDELIALLRYAKSALRAEKARKGRGFGYVLANFGAPYTHWGRR